MKKTEEELQALANQLSCPDGETGKELGATMHNTNIGMTRATIDCLKLENQQTILELGHGNASHVPELLAQASGLEYTGLELSKTMQQEAMRINQSFVEASAASFHCYDGKTIPFENNQFDRIMTVNTIYFWHNTFAMLDELYRVLRVGGILAVTFAHKEFMEKLPFVKDNFELFDAEDLLILSAMTPLEWLGSVEQTELVKSKTGEMVNRSFSVVLLGK